MSSNDHLSELESLRSQVADLAQELAERDRSMQDLRDQSQRLRTIIEGTGAVTGDEFFSSMVKHLTAALHVQYAVIGEVLEGRLRKIRTLAVSAGGTLADNFEYELAHTPCATALAQTFACFSQDVQATFPQFQRLADLGAESYCGVPLRTKGGAVIGLLVVMDTKPLPHGNYLQSLLGAFAPRVAVEIERSRTKQERDQALADLHNVVETAPDIMFTLDRQGNMVKWNRRVRDVTGYSPEELLNKPALAFVPPEEQTRTAAAIQRAFTEGYAELEGHLLTKEHRLIPYHWTGALLKNPHGEPIGITGIGRDVSDKKRTEKELQKRRRHLVEAQAIAHLGSWVWDIDTGEVQWSDELFRIFGHEPGLIHVTYDTFLAALLPGDHDRVLAAINEALVGKLSYDIESRIVRPNGEVRSIHARGDVHRDVTGHPLSMAGTVLDITERKRIEDALRASEERWELAVRGSNDGIWDWNIRAGDIFFSPRWKAMRGFEDHDITNHVDEWRSRIHPDDLDRVLESIDAYLAKQTPEFCEEYRVQKKDGSYMWVLDRGMALWADDGTPIRMAGSESDITERKRANSLLEVSLNSIEDGLLTIDRHGKVVSMNQRFLVLWRIPQDLAERREDELLLAFVLEQLQEPEAFLSKVRELYEHPEQESFDTLTFRDGRVFERYSRPQVLENEIVGRIWSFRDRTARQRTEEALRVSEERFALAVAGSTDILWDANRLPGEPWYAPQTPIWWSPRVRELLALEESESFETLEQWAARLHPDDKDRVFGQLAAHIEQRVPYDAEYRLRTNRGDYLWVRGRGQAMWDEQGEPRRMSGSCQDITERKQAQEALCASEAQFRALAESTTDWMWEINEEGRYTYCSPKICDLLGYEPGEALGKTPFDFMPEEEARRVAGLFGPIAAARKPFARIENTNRHKDGRLVVLECRGVPIIDDNGVFGGYRGFDHDITERKRGEEAIREAELRYRTIFEQAGAGVAQIESHTGRFVQVNRQYCEILGLAEAETLAATVGAVTHPDDLERDLESMTRLLSGEIPSFTMEKRYVRKDGSIVWANLNVAPLWRSGETPVHHIAIAQDITERKRAEDALRCSEGQLRTVLDALPVGVWFTDRSGKPLLANPAAKQIWSNIKQIGLQTPDNQSSWWETSGPANEPHRWALSRVLTTGVPSLGETFDFECLDGTKKVIRNSTVPVQSEAGVTLGAIVLNEDITMLRQAQAALRLTQFSVDHAVEGFLWIGPDARIFHVNDSACRMLEYTWEELTTMTLHDIDPSFLPELWPAHWEELKQKGSMTFESKYWSSTGRVLDTEVTVNYLQYEGREYNCAIMRDIGERRQANEALRVSEERFRSIFQNEPECVKAVAPDGTLLVMNPAGLIMVGARFEEEIIGKSVLSLIYPDDRPAFQKLHQAVCSGGSGSLQFRINSLQGEVRWMDTHSVPLRDAAGGVTAALSITRDITERKQAEAALRRSEGRFRIMFAQAPIGIAFIDSLTGQIHEVNARYAQIAGRTMEELLGLDWMSISHPDDVQADMDDMAKLVTGDIAGYQMEKRLVRPDGAIAWIHLTVAPIQVEAYAGPHHLAMMQDITARKQAEESLRQSEGRLRSFMMNSPSLVFFKALDGRYLYINREFERLFQLSAEHIIGKTDYEVFPREQADQFAVNDRRVLQEGHAIETEETASYEDGTHTSLVMKFPVYGADGSDDSVWGIGGIVTDITLRKRAERALRLTQFAVDRGADMAFWIDRSARILYVNDATCQRLGYSRDELLAMTVPDLDPDYQLSRWTQHWDDLRAQKRLRFETSHRTKSGEIFPVEIVANHVAFEGQEYNFAFSRDITDRKRSEEVLHQRERDLRAAIEERVRISQDLHDGILQSLFAVGLALESAKLTMSPRNRKTSGAPIDQAIDQLNLVMREVRNFIAGLGSDLLQGQDLPRALQQMLASLTENQATRVRLAVEDRAAKAVSVEQSLHLFLVIQEAVSNCIQHGRAQEARVSLKMLKQGVRLSIRDNGRGFNLDAAKGTGHGLGNMAARAQKMGGRFTILSKVNEGTSIVLDLPKEAADVRS